MGCELYCNRMANATATPGHNGDLPLKIEVGCAFIRKIQSATPFRQPREIV